MYIDKKKVKEVFQNYVDNYDSSNTKIKLKIDHTYRVSEICERLALSLGFTKEDTDIAYLMGLLHDIGRFEQVKRYGTFNDSKSINHAKLSAEILFEDNMIRKFIEDDREDELIKIAIELHNVYILPENLSKRTLDFCNILRDADKIDIFKVNTIESIEDIYSGSCEEIYTSSVTKEVLNQFKNNETILRTLKKTDVDNIVSHISLVFGLIFDESIKITQEQGYLNKIIQFKSENPETNEQFKEIREIVNLYMKDRIKNIC